MTATDIETPMSPLLEVRVPLHDGLRTLAAAAEAIDKGADWQAPLDNALAFLQDEFVPACLGENFTLLGAVNGIFRSPEAANVMMHQHDSIRRMVGDLAKVTEAARKAPSLTEFRTPLFMLLYGLYGVGRVHLESEETAYFGPIADHLSESQVRVLSENLVRISAGSNAPNQDLTGDRNSGSS
jgi:hypothetical protein